MGEQSSASTVPLRRIVSVSFICILTMLASLVTMIIPFNTASAAANAAIPRYSDDGTTITLTEPASGKAPAYTLKIPHATFSVSTLRGSQVVLKTASGSHSAIDFTTGGATKSVTDVKSAKWQNGVLTLTLDTSDSSYTVNVTITPQSGQYRLQASVQGPQTPSQISTYYDMATSGHWYGHGETNTDSGGPNTDQAWPLDSKGVLDTNFGPSSYQMIEPFWFTQKGSGFYVKTVKTMTVSLGKKQSGVAGFSVSDTSLDMTDFVGQTARDVYFDYIAIAGKPTKSDATPIEFQEPLWNDYPEFYGNKTQTGMLDYVQKIHDAGIPAHTFQIDGGWGAGFTWNNTMFPDPKAMITKIHSLGYKFGLWVTFWVNPTDPDYSYLSQHGYLLKSKTDATQPCKVDWFGGSGAGIVDLANPDANKWYMDQLNSLMSSYGVDGFKFDTQFFDDACAPYKTGLTDVDYANLGAQLADHYDQQGAGIRVHWTGSQKYGFVVREVDKGTSFISLQAAIKQVMAISTIGYPFVETDYIGGSLAQPLPTKQVLVRWAQAAALMPFMYSGVSPLGALNVGGDGKWYTYDAETIQLYKDATLLHGRLTPYILEQAKQAVATGEPIVRPLFFDFPNDQATYAIGDEWMLGPAVLAAPNLSNGDSRNVHLPPGNWYDINQDRVIKGPVDLNNYYAPLDVTPTFVRIGAQGSNDAIKALARMTTAPVSVHVNLPDSDQLTVGQPTTLTVTAYNWGKNPAQNVAVNLSATGWHITSNGSSTFSQIQSGASATASFQVTIPASTKWGPVTVTGTATYTEANKSGTATETMPVLVVPTPNNSSVQAPFHTYANVDAQYAESSDQSQFALFTQGQDLYQGTDQKSQMYEQQALGNQTVTVRVATLQGGGPNAKAGIVIANDVTNTAKGGYLVFTVSRAGGLELQWDADGDGVLDNYYGGSGSTAPIWLQVTRSGTSYTTAWSSDGTTWQAYHTLTIASAGTTEDVGMVASAANADYPGVAATALFDNFAVK